MTTEHYGASDNPRSVGLVLRKAYAHWCRFNETEELDDELLAALKLEGYVVVRDSSGLLNHGEQIEQMGWWDTAQHVMWPDPDPLDASRCVPVWRRVEAS